MSVGQAAGAIAGGAKQRKTHVSEEDLAGAHAAAAVGRWLPVVAALLGVVTFLLVRRSLTDDAYITLSYAKNLAVHGTWGMVPGEAANSATSPLNVLLLGALTLVTRISGAPHPVLALGALTVAAGASLGWSWLRLVRALRIPPAAGLLGVVLVLVNPFLLSAFGLEVLLIPAVLMLLTVFAVEGRPILFGAAAGLAVLTRLDLVVFVVLIAASAAPIRRRAWLALAAAVAVAAPWFLFSWFAFGSFVPDTLVIKQSQASLFAPWSYVNGPVMYALGRPIVVLLTFAPAVLGVLALAAWAAVRFAVRWPRVPPLGPVAALGAGGVLNYVVYSLLDVGPYHWYYVTPVVATGAFAVVAFGVWQGRARERPTLRSGPPLAALGLVGVLTLALAGVDGAQGVPWRSPVIFGNWASAQDYARVGKDLGKRLNGATVASPGEIGTLAYYCDCAILDVFSDRGQVVGLVNDQIAAAGPVMRTALRVNYHWFDRSHTPRKVDYRLRYESGPASGPDSWQVYSATKGVGHFTLVRAV
ncbi:hypothetical protein [Amycolatopsis sp. NPDC059021]|uniref:hypothetical protein n=1 Tax=Amycolatopsis sp. NPDC059021 TaxID=3346704 RepID=UPI00366F83AF